MKKKLSVLIPFLNEREEVITTVKEVRRTVGYNVDIVVVNDCSTDDYDYYKLLEPYKVTYIQNEQNLGSAPSRDICVKNCKTPYFLFLDAHMRFYENNWHIKIIKLLEVNDRRIICSDTLCLEKNNFGEVVVSCNQTTTYGAYMPLIEGKLLPDIKWNNMDLNPNDNLKTVPCILGAAYAGSVRYWIYLRGMEGLKKYGCEEQFISMKVWLEGGKCFILKDFIVGHVYRKKSPYRHYDVEEMYNHLFISSLLFPTAIKARSHAAAIKINRTSYNEANNLIKNECELNNRLEFYLGNIFTKTFKYFLHQNQKIQKELIDKELCTYFDKIPKVAEYLFNHPVKQAGFIDGKMGQYLWFTLYFKFTNDSQYINYSETLFFEICSSIDEPTTLSDLNSGFSGIGWAILFLYEHNLLSSANCKILGSIDKKLNLISPSQIKNHSILFGTAGILSYVILRLKNRIKLGSNLSEDLLYQFDLVSKSIIDDASSNIKELTQAFYYLEIRKGNVDNYVCGLSDIINLKSNFPANSKYWGNTLLDANISTTTLIMLADITIKEYSNEI